MRRYRCRVRGRRRAATMPPATAGEPPARRERASQDIAASSGDGAPVKGSTAAKKLGEQSYASSRLAAEHRRRPSSHSSASSLAPTRTHPQGTPFLGPIGWLWNEIYYSIFQQHRLMIMFGWSCSSRPSSWCSACWRPSAHVRLAQEALRRRQELRTNEQEMKIGIARTRTATSPRPTGRPDGACRRRNPLCRRCGLRVPNVERSSTSSALPVHYVPGTTRSSFPADPRGRRVRQTRSTSRPRFRTASTCT